MAGLLLTGCHAPPTASGPTELVVHVSDREVLMERVATLLRERDFAPQRFDTHEGLIVSKPSTSQQWFEFWRHDAIGAYQLFEASIHTIRRIVTVHFRTLPDDPQACQVQIEVAKQRYSAPERQVTTSSGALGIYSERLPTTRGRLERKADVEHWVSLGRDVLLERYLADLIARAAERSETASAAPASAPGGSPEAAEKPSAG